MTFSVANKRRHSAGHECEQEGLPVPKKQCVSQKPLIANHHQDDHEQLLWSNQLQVNQYGHVIEGQICKNVTSSHCNSPPQVMNQAHLSNQTSVANIYSYYHGSPIYNPSLTLEQNPVYFKINRVLFEAHLESTTRRQGFRCKVAE